MAYMPHIACYKATSNEDLFIFFILLECNWIEATTTVICAYIPEAVSNLMENDGES